MTPAAHLQSSIVLLGEIDSVARPADAVVSAWFRQHKTLEDTDRGAILHLVYGALRHRARLGWWLERIGLEQTPRTMMLVYLALVERKPRAQIERVVSGVLGGPDALTLEELTALDQLQGATIVHPDMADGVRLECPDWALASLKQRFGEDFNTEMTALLELPGLDLRVNTLKSHRDAILKELWSLDVPAEKSAKSPNAILIPQRMSLSRLPALKRGDVEIQDEGSQLVAMLVDARAGHRVVDFCAGACGKTLAIAAQMQNKGQIIACDVNAGRLARGAERLRHAGVHNVETRVIASETDRWIKRHKGIYDRVLVDAPCSGTGTWRRNPDARWREYDAMGLDNLVALQARILASAARLVKVGGRLVYATCSLLTEENEAQVTAFLDANPAFRLVAVKDVVPRFVGLGDTPYLSLTPARHQTDGFFAAIIERIDTTLTETSGSE